MNKNKVGHIYITLLSVGNILGMILTPLLMYVIYALNKDSGTANVAMGYWVGFIFIIIPIISLIYTYIFHLKNKDDNSFYYSLITGILSLIVIIFFLCSGFTI